MAEMLELKSRSTNNRRSYVLADKTFFTKLKKKIVDYFACIYGRIHQKKTSINFCRTISFFFQARPKREDLVKFLSFVCTYIELKISQCHSTWNEFEDQRFSMLSSR